MPATSDVKWDTCVHEDCIGVRLRTGDRCWAHADEPDLETALERVSKGGYLDARGVQVTTELLKRILAAAPQENQRPTLTTVEFQLATFTGDARFDGVEFKEAAHFFDATFQHSASFSRATFRGWAAFQSSTFNGEARFQIAAFHDVASFQHSTFQTDAAFHHAVFHAAAAFHHITFHRDATFTDATFHADALFSSTTVYGDASFIAATFQDTSIIGPLMVRRRLGLVGAVFHQRLQIQAAATAVCAGRARFLAGVQLQVRWAQIVLDDADLAAPSILAGVALFPDLDETWFVKRWERLPYARLGDRPRLVSVRRADVAGLTIADVDLRACRFTGAHHLDQLRIEGEAHFAPAPRGWRWTKRQTLAEEHHWRHSDGTRGWYPAACQPPNWSEPRRDPTPPLVVAALYRALRKGREDRKDEPGAADFYYGEMEMRRHARRLVARQAWKDREIGRWIASATEYSILTFYWLISGYAVVAWRALAALLMILLLAAVGFAYWGFAAPEEPSRPVRIDPSGGLVYEQPPSAARPAGIDVLPEAIRFAARSATALLRGPERPLTPVGEWLEITVRLLGPVLLGLAILSIRGRVKR